LVGFPLLSFPIFYFFDLPYKHLLEIQSNHIYLIPIFLSIGIVFGLIVIWLTELEYFEKSMSKYKNRLQGHKITVFYAFFLSFCAGFGEEIFFRGALQPLMGVWVTSFFFVAIHGYFSFKNFRINVFALLLTLFIALLGWSSKEYSIILAISGHFSYDLVLLFYYRYTDK